MSLLTEQADTQLDASTAAYGWRPVHFRPSEFFRWAYEGATTETRPYIEAVNAGILSFPGLNSGEWLAMWRHMEAVGMAADAVREQLGPLQVTLSGGVRFPQSHPSKYAETPGSQHFKGAGLDLVPLAAGVTGDDVYRVAAALQASGDIPQGGAHSYGSFAHLDVRGRRARW